MRYYDEIAEIERDGFTIIVDKTWEDISPDDLFEAEDVGEIKRKIDNGTYDWFMMRVRVMIEGYELGSHYLGGMCYENAKDVMTDGTAEDCICEALKEAKAEKVRLAKMLEALPA